MGRRTINDNDIFLQNDKHQSLKQNTLILINYVEKSVYNGFDVLCTVDPRG